MSRTPPSLSDWRVCLNVPGPVLTVRATSLAVRDGFLFLDDATGQPLAAVPVSLVQHARRSEPREDKPRPIDQALVTAVADEVERRQQAKAAT